MAAPLKRTTAKGIIKDIYRRAFDRATEGDAIFDAIYRRSYIQGYNDARRAMLSDLAVWHDYDPYDDELGDNPEGWGCAEACVACYLDQLGKRGAVPEMKEEEV